MVVEATAAGEAACTIGTGRTKPTSPSVADVLRRFAPDYLVKYASSLEAYQTRTLEQLLQCRTAALGGQSWHCDACGKRHCRYHSCRNRHCPTCNGPSRSDWLERMLEDRLPVRYSHIVFTVPHELISARRGPSPRALRLAVRRGVAGDGPQRKKTSSHKNRRHDGAAHLGTAHQIASPRPHNSAAGGAFARRFAMGRLHDPHDLVDGAGLADRFRALFLDRLERMFSSGELRLPYKLLGEETPAALAAWLAPLRCKGWIVNVQTPPAHCEGPEAALKYLAGYVRGAAIGNRRIVSLTRDKVTFTYKDYRRGGEEATATISGEEFVRRFLLHVLPPDFRRVRHRGFLCNRNRTQEIARIRELLGATPEAHEENCSREDQPQEADAFVGDADAAVSMKAPRCPHCGADEMIWQAEIPPQVDWVARRYSRFALEAAGAGFGTTPFRPP